MWNVHIYGYGNMKIKSSEEISFECKLNDEIPITFQKKISLHDRKLE